MMNKTIEQVRKLATRMQPGLSYEYNDVQGILYMTDHYTNKSDIWLCKEHPKEINEAYTWLTDQQKARRMH
jgi:hypothetical protein